MRKWKSNGWSNKVWLLIATVLGVGFHLFDWWWAPFAAIAAGALSLIGTFEGRLTELRQDIHDLNEKLEHLHYLNKMSVTSYSESAHLISDRSPFGTDKNIN